MFDASNLPKGCTLIDSGTTLQCLYFSYKINQNGYVAAKKRNNPYANTYVLLSRNTNQLYCQAAAGDTSAEACDAFGLDVVAAGISF